MDLGRNLVTKLIDEGKVKEVVRAGITSDFLDESSSRQFDYIFKHLVEYKEVPSREALLRAFPSYEFAEPQEPIEYYIEEIKETFRRNILEEKFIDLARTYQDIPTKDTEEAIRSLLGDLAITGKSHKDIDLAKDSFERIELYQRRKEKPGADGILTNWSKVDYLTLGWHPEEFIVLVGDKYIGKSWLMLWMAYQAMLQGEIVLFVTKEMSQIALANRFDSIYASVCFDSLRRGELSNVEEDRYKEKLTEFNESNHKMIMARQGVSSIQEIEQKAIEVDASIVFIDSVYLFPPDSKTMYQSETAKRKDISQRCKDAAQSLSIPWVVSTQARRKQTKTKVFDIDDIEYSNAFAQDADVVMMLSKDEVDRELGRIKLDVVKSRDGDIGSIYVRTDFDYMTFKEDVIEVEPTTNIEFDEEEGETWND